MFPASTGSEPPRREPSLNGPKLVVSASKLKASVSKYKGGPWTVRRPQA